VTIARATCVSNRARDALTRVSATQVGGGEGQDTQDHELDQNDAGQRETRRGQTHEQTLIELRGDERTSEGGGVAEGELDPHAGGRRGREDRHPEGAPR
jgi:hypothetical protein